MIPEQSLQNFLDTLASSAATPGGGSAAAISGAMGAALVSMVANLTIGKKKYAEVEGEAQEILARAEALRAQLTAYVTEDVAAFDKVMAAYSLPRQNDEEKAAREAAIQAGLQNACLPPLNTARACAEVLGLSRQIAAIGNSGVISDAGVGGLCAYAGLKSAALNVLINVNLIKDDAFKAAQTAELNAILAGQEALTAAVYELVKSRM